MPKHRILIADLVAATEIASGVTKKELLSRESGWRVARPRQVAMEIAFEVAGRRKSEIARAFGRHPATVTSAIAAVRRRAEEGDEETRALRAKVLCAVPDVVARRGRNAGHAGA